MEYIALFVIDVPTNEGLCHLYLGYDPYLDQLMQLALENERNINTLLKSIFYLGEMPLFVENRKDDFTLILTELPEEKQRVEKMLEMMNGKPSYDEPYYMHLLKPVMDHLNEFFRNKMK